MSLTFKNIADKITNNIDNMLNYDASLQAIAEQASAEGKALAKKRAKVVNTMNNHLAEAYEMCRDQAKPFKEFYDEYGVAWDISYNYAIKIAKKLAGPKPQKAIEDHRAKNKAQQQVHRARKRELADSQTRQPLGVHNNDEPDDKPLTPILSAKEQERVDIVEGTEKTLKLYKDYSDNAVRKIIANVTKERLS